MAPYSGGRPAAPANIRTDLTGARENIVDAAKKAFLDAGKDPALIRDTHAVLGLAGSNVGTYWQQLETILPFAQSRVVTDALIALEGAVGEGDGAMAILGTGTAYMVRRNGVARAIGGWGFQVGDQGAGSRIGRELLEETLLAHDGIRPASPLTAEILSVFRNEPQDVVEFTINAKPGDYGGFAPKVFDSQRRATRWRRRSCARGQRGGGLACRARSRRHVAALPARRAGAALRRAAFAEVPAASQSPAAGRARRRGRDGGANVPTTLEKAGG